MTSVAYFPTVDENPNFISRPPDPGSFNFYTTIGKEALYHSPFSGTRRFSELMLEKSDYFNVDGRLLDPREANERFGLGGQLVFDEPIKESAAELMMRRKIAENDRAYTIQSGSTTGMRQLAGIGVGMAASFLDPVNFGSMFVPVVGEARFARMVARFGGSYTKARLASGAIEGAAGAAMVEPFVLLPALQEQANYGLADSALNLGFGATLGSFLHAGFGAIGDRLKRLKPRESDAIFEAAMNNILRDEPVTAPARLEEFTEAFQLPYRMEFADISDNSSFAKLSPEMKIERIDPSNNLVERFFIHQNTRTGTFEGNVELPWRISQLIQEPERHKFSDIDGDIYHGVIPEQPWKPFYHWSFLTKEQALSALNDLRNGFEPPDQLEFMPNRDEKGKFLSVDERIRRLSEKLEADKIRKESQGQNIHQETKTDISRIDLDNMRNTSESPEVLNQITSEADELQSVLDRRVPIDDDERIEFEAEQQALKDELKATIGNPKKREDGVNAAITCITQNLI